MVQGLFQKHRRLTGHLIVFLFCFAVFPSRTPSVIAEKSADQEIRLGNLDNHNPVLKRLRSEISDNLRSVARSGRPVHPFRVYIYRVQEKEHFYRVMASVSQDEDTLASLNDLINPAEVAEGSILRIPNVRGVFFEKKDKEKIDAYYGSSAYRMDAKDGIFVPGVKFLPEQRDYFRGVGFRFPLEEGKVSSRYGNRIDPFTNRLSFHGGIDLAAPRGTRVFAGKDGTVHFSGIRGGYGHLVILEHKFGYQTYYGHLSRRLVKNGQRVKRGEVIGLVGSTGRSTGPHLHFEVRREGRRERPKFVHH